MTFFESLIDDHKRAKAQLQELLDQVQSDEKPLKNQLVKLCEELEIHMQIEESVLYPECKKNKAVTEKGLIKDAYSEHEEIKSHLQELKEGNMEMSIMERTLKEMHREIEHHTKDEEEKLFPLLKQEWSEDKIQDITKRLQTEKEELKSAR